jgi:hypothetical protein
MLLYKGVDFCFCRNYKNNNNNNNNNKIIEVSLALAITLYLQLNTGSLRPGVPDSLFCVRMSQHGLGLKKEGKKQNIIDPVFNSSAVLFFITPCGCLTIVM